MCVENGKCETSRNKIYRYEKCSFLFSLRVLSREEDDITLYPDDEEIKIDDCQTVRRPAGRRFFTARERHVSPIPHVMLIIANNAC